MLNAYILDDAEQSSDAPVGNVLLQQLVLSSTFDRQIGPQPIREMGHSLQYVSLNHCSTIQLHQFEMFPDVFLIYEHVGQIREAHTVRFLGMHNKENV